MKSRAFRAAGVVAALLIPASGLTMLGAGVAGATPSTETLTVSFAFSSTSLTSNATCTPNSVTVTGATVTSAGSTSCTTTTTSGTLTLGVTTSTLVWTGSSIYRSPPTGTGHLVFGTGVGFVLTLGSGTCTVHFMSAIDSATTTSAKKYTFSTVFTAGNVTYSGTCSSVQALLTTSSSKFSGSVKFSTPGLT